MKLFAIITVSFDKIIRRFIKTHVYISKMRILMRSNEMRAYDREISVSRYALHKDDERERVERGDVSFSLDEINQTVRRTLSNQNAF